jgi:hypothetical protein
MSFSVTSSHAWDVTEGEYIPIPKPTQKKMAATTITSSIFFAVIVSIGFFLQAMRKPSGALDALMSVFKVLAKL